MSRPTWEEHPDNDLSRDLSPYTFYTSRRKKGLGRIFYRGGILL